MHNCLDGPFKVRMPDIVAPRTPTLIRDYVQQSIENVRYISNGQHTFHSKIVDAYSKSYQHDRKSRFLVTLEKKGPLRSRSGNS